MNISIIRMVKNFSARVVSVFIWRLSMTLLFMDLMANLLTGTTRRLETKCVISPKHRVKYVIRTFL